MKFCFIVEEFIKFIFYLSQTRTQEMHKATVFPRQSHIGPSTPLSSSVISCLFLISILHMKKKCTSQSKIHMKKGQMSLSRQAFSSCNFTHLPAICMIHKPKFFFHSQYVMTTSDYSSQRQYFSVRSHVNYTVAKLGHKTIISHTTALLFEDFTL